MTPLPLVSVSVLLHVRRHRRRVWFKCERCEGGVNLDGAEGGTPWRPVEVRLTSNCQKTESPQQGSRSTVLFFGLVFGLTAYEDHSRAAEGVIAAQKSCKDILVSRVELCLNCIY